MNKDSFTDKEFVRCRVHSRKVSSSAKLCAVSEVFSRKKNTSILGGNPSDAESNRFSVFAAEPLEVFEFKAGADGPFVKLQQALNKYKSSNDTNLPGGMFCGGWIGYFSYDLGQYIEKVPCKAKDDLNIPLVRLCFYDRAVCYDQTEKSWYLIALEIEPVGKSYKDKLDEMAIELERAENLGRIFLGGEEELQFNEKDLGKIGCNITKEYYLDAIARTKKYIYDGDVYQINFSQRFEFNYTAEAIKLYHWQNRYNPSPYAAYIDGGSFKVVSASPEMFLTVQDGVVSTKPIKGTRERIAGTKNAEQINEANFNELVQSEKDQAELNMIIDLERNDLTRICRYGTIKVIQPRTIETFATVFHAVATVQGQLHEPLRKPLDMEAILRATFPGGSITGAPKIRSMEIIDELEPTQRSVYTGSVGFIGVDNNMALNIAIRTVIIKGGVAYAQTGGGIVADSDAHAEWDETIAKAKALLAGITAIQKKHEVNAAKRGKKTDVDVLSRNKK